MAKKIEVALTLDNSKFNRQVKQSEKQVDQFSKSSSISIGKLGAAFAALGGAALIKNIVTIGQSFQDLRSSLAAVTGGVEEGQAAFDNLTTLATQTQFGVEELTQSYIRLTAAGLTPTNELLLSFAGAASITQDQIGSLTAFTELFARALGKGKLELTDFDKIAERGIDIYGLLTDKFGMTIDQIKELAKTASGQKQLFKGIQEVLEDTYGEALPLKLKNSSIAFSNLNIAIRSLADASFQQLGLSDTTAIEGLTKAINDLAKNTDGLGKIFNTVGDILYALGTGFLAISVTSKKAFGPMIAIIDKVKGAIAGLFRSFKDLGFAVGLLKSVKSLGGLAVVLAAIGSAGTLSAAAIASIVLAIDGILNLFGLGFIPYRKFAESLGLIAKEADEAEKSVKKLKEELFVGPPVKLFDEDQFNKLTDNDTLFDMEPQAAPPTSLELFADLIDRSKGDLDAYNDLMKTFNLLFSDTSSIQAMEERATALNDLNNSYAHLFDPLDAFNELVNEGVDSQEEYNSLQKELNRLYELGIFNLKDLEEAQRNLDEAFGDNEGLLSFIDTLNSATDTLTTDLAGALMEGKGAMDSFKGFFKTLVQQVIADALKLLLIIPILQAIGFTTVGGSVTGLSGKGFLGAIGFKQTGIGGGNLMPNRPVLVGEAGPEVFYPASSGSLQPNAMAQQVTYNINAVDAPSFQALVARDPEFIYSVTRAGARRLPGAR